MITTVKECAFKNSTKHLKIIAGKIPDDAGAVGAAKTAFQRAEEINEEIQKTVQSTEYRVQRTRN